MYLATQMLIHKETKEIVRLHPETNDSTFNWDGINAATRMATKDAIFWDNVKHYEPIMDSNGVIISVLTSGEDKTPIISLAEDERITCILNKPPEAI